MRDVLESKPCVPSSPCKNSRVLTNQEKSPEIRADASHLRHWRRFGCGGDLNLQPQVTRRADAPDAGVSASDALRGTPAGGPGNLSTRGKQGLPSPRSRGGCPPGGVTGEKNIAACVRDRLMNQARASGVPAQAADPLLEVIPARAGRGFAALVLKPTIFPPGRTRSMIPTSIGNPDRSASKLTSTASPN